MAIWSQALPIMFGNNPFTESGTHPSYAKDASGKITGLAGLSVLSLAEQKNAFTVSLFGDSLTNACTTVSASALANNTLGYYTFLNTLARGRLKLIGEYGYSGFKATDMLANLSTVVAAGAEICIYESGANAIPAYLTAPLATELAADETIIRALTANGRVCIVTACPPRTEAISIPAMAKYLADLNNGKKALCDSIQGAIYVDWFSVLAAPDTGDWVSGYNNVDGVHPIAKGALYAARAIFNRIDGMLGTVRPLDNNKFDPTNLWWNGQLQGANASGTGGFVAGTGVTGNGPDGHRIQRSAGSMAAVLSSASRPTDDIRGGNCLQLAITGDGTGANNITLQYRALSAAWTNSASVAKGEARRPTTPNGYRYVMISANGTAGSAEPTWPTTLGATVTDNASKVWLCVEDFNAGDVIRLLVDFAPDSFSGDFHVYGSIQAVNESSTILFTSSDLLNVYDTATQPAFGSGFQPAGRLVTLPMTIPSGTTRLYFNVFVAAATGVTGNLKITSCRVEKVTYTVTQA